MMKRIALSLLAIAAVLVLEPKGSAAGTPPLTVAVFDFEAHDTAVASLGAQISSLLNATLSAEANLITVERAELAKVLGEQELGLSGTVSTETAAKVGHLTGA